MWQASIEEEFHFVTPPILKCYNRHNLEGEDCCLRPSYSGDLKIRNNHSSDSLGLPCLSVWVGDGHEGVGRV
jgi:hypothetical protein